MSAGWALPAPADLDGWARGVLARSSPSTGLLVALACPGPGARAFRLTYAAFRVLDDAIDAPGARGADLQPLAHAVEAALAGRPGTDAPTQALAQVLTGPLGARLRPAVLGMWAAQRADIARREGPLARPAHELEAQRARIGDSYLEALWVCSGAPGEAPAGLRPLARAATGAHWLRDLEEDRALGYCNVPAEVLAAAGLEDPEPAALQPWLARRRAELRAEQDAGLAALAAQPVPWRTRWLLRLLAWRYRRWL